MKTVPSLLISATRTTVADVVPIRASDDVVKVRHAVRAKAVEIKLSLIDQTKIITAASELARNVLQYGGGGMMEMETLRNGGRTGLRLTFIDEGPGIPDLDLALKDGYTTGGGLGLGLSGARRLSNEFSIDTEVGKGTRVSITRWK
ncbi:MAG TPA: anti-sigma regulatory factor [Stellaceae bacterium]|jgi:serine/threonine-protein kinase RsbT